MEKPMSRSIHRLMFVSLFSILLLAAPVGAAPSLPAEPASTQASPSLFDSFLSFLANAFTIGIGVTVEADTTTDGTTSSGGGSSTTSGSCIDPLGCPK